MKVAVLFSGGKDSCYSLYKAMQAGHQIKYLVSVFPRSPASWMFHYPNIRLTETQAKIMGIEIITKVILGKREKEVFELKDVLTKIKSEIEGIVSGAIASQYQKSRIELLTKELGLKSLTPLWGKDPQLLWDELLKAGFEIIITGVAADGLDKSWLGKKIDSKSLTKLKKLSQKYRFHLAGEGGEFETVVLAGPIFKKKLKIIKAKKTWDKKTGSGLYVIQKVKLV